MTARILIGDCREVLRTLPDESVHCVVTSPPYWGLRDYGVAGQLGMEKTLGEHIAVMVDVFREVRRVMRNDATLWLNYGDCYATSPNGRSAADTKAAGNDDRTFRDKPFSTIGPIMGHALADGAILNPERSNVIQTKHPNGTTPRARIEAGGYLKAKDLCMIPNRLAIALQDDGWWVRSEIIWAKPNPMPESVTDRPACAHEKVWLLSKSKTYHYDAEAVRRPLAESSGPRLAQDLESQAGSTRANGGAKTNGPMKAVRGRQTYGKHTLNEAVPERSRRRALDPRHEGHINHQGLDATPRGEANLRNVWTIPTAAFSEAHFATFPPALVEPCIKAGCPIGGTVLDPFGGAGTTGLVADRLGRNSILIELNPEYAAMAERRIKNDAPLLTSVAAE